LDACPDTQPVDRPTAVPNGRSRLTRRAALVLGAAAGGAAALGGRVATAVAQHVPAKPTPDRPPPSNDLITYEEARLAFRCHGFHLEQLRHDITPLGSHFQLVHFDIPRTDLIDSYRVTVGGRVRNPLTLALDELQGRDVVHEAAIMECAGNGRSFAHPRAIYVPWFQEAIGVFRYTGTPLRPILEEAGLLDDAVEVVFTGWDHGIDLGVHHHFERSLPIDEAMKDGVMLAWAANDQPLLQAHGFPLRLVVPTWYGMASVKWLKSITVIDHPFEGVEQKLVYRLTFSASDLGRPVQQKSVRAAMLPPGYPDLLSRYRFASRGRQVLEGKAWSGHGPIVKVEVSTDDRRSWRSARLDPPVSAFSWTPWTFVWDTTPGEYVLSCRATDAAGNTQPLEPFWNLQGMAQNGVETWGVRVT
jgi:sulfane dehydrogenase subunit SoxC